MIIRRLIQVVVVFLMLISVVLVGNRQFEGTTNTTVNTQDITQDIVQDDNQDYNQNPLQTDTAVAENDLNKPDSLIFDSETSTASVNIYITDEYALNLVRYTDFKEGDTIYEYELVTDLEAESLPRIEVSDMIINNETKLPGVLGLNFTDTNRIGNRWFFKASNITDYLLFNEDCFFEQFSGILVDKGTNNDDKTKTPVEFTVDIPAISSNEYLFLPVLDAMAQTQTISDDGRVKVELLGCGAFNYSDSSDMEFAVECTNLTDNSLYFSIAGVVVNGTFFDKECWGEIGAGQKEIVLFSLRASDMKEQNISTIYDLALLILTEAQDDKTKEDAIYRGAKLYPIKLACSGEYYETEFDGKLVYDKDNIQVYFTGFETKDQSGLLICNYIVNNMSDEYISINFLDGKADGAKCSIGHPVLYKTDLSYVSTEGELFSVAPGCNIKEKSLFQNIAEPSSVRTLECDLIITTVGGSEMLGSDIIVFGNEEE